MLIIFDLDDTLVDTSAFITPKQLRKAFLCMQHLGANLSESALQELWTLNAVSGSSLEALEEFVRRRNIPKDFYMRARYVLDQELPEDMTIQPVNGAIDVLRQLQVRHLLAVVSYGDLQRQLYKLEKAGIDSAFFCKILVSDERNKEKYYLDILRAEQMSPEKVVVCGDRIEGDLVPAKKLGCTTVHMQRGRGILACGVKTVVDFVVSDLIQFACLMKSLSNDH